VSGSVGAPGGRRGCRWHPDETEPGRGAAAPRSPGPPDV